MSCPAAAANEVRDRGGGGVAEQPEHVDAQAEEDGLVEALCDALGIDGQDMLQQVDQIAADFGDHVEGDHSGSESDNGDDGGAAAARADPVAGVGAASAASAEVERGGPEEEAVSAANCIRTLAHVKTSAEVERFFPDIECPDSRWRTKVRSTGQVLGQIRCIVGQSFRADCKMHKADRGQPVCKMHCNILGKSEELDALMQKWIIAGTAMSADEHRQAAIDLTQRWAAGSE